jgi:glycosyltransferase involved in cell wall biosynthesis
MREKVREVGVQVHAVAEAGGLRIIRRARDLVRVLRLHPGCTVHLHLQGDSGGTLILLAARLARVTAIVRTLHNPPVPPISRLHRLTVGISDRLLDKLICVSAETRREHLQHLGRDPQKIVVIPHGVDLERFSSLSSREDVRRELGLSKEDTLVGTVARLDEERKGIAEFIKMAALLAQGRPQVRFVVVGEGRLRRDLESQAARLGLAGRCLFTGYRQDVPLLLAAMDIAVFPSTYEAGPYVLLEAMAMSRAVVITPTGLAVDIIQSGVNGILVPFRHLGAMCDAVETLVGDPAMAGRLGRAARELIVKGYSKEVMVAGIERLYKELGPRIKKSLAGASTA